MYQMCEYDKYDYTCLSKISTLTRSGRNKQIVNNAFIMFDTETSKKADPSTNDNHVVAFTISIRSKHENIVTLYGHNPVECVDCLERIHHAMNGDTTIFYAHNMPYDYVFLRLFLFEKFGRPVKMLNIKSHYPINIVFSNGIILKDSLVLAQRSLDKWAKDLDVEHKKSVGLWNYDKIRTQHEVFTPEELEYIEHDTLAGVECLDLMSAQLHHYVYAMPYTATGIPREEARNIGKQNRAHTIFERISPSYDIYLILEKVFHGGYTHANRYMINDIVEGLILCLDFTSSYPFVMLTEKYPMGQFRPYKECDIDTIIRNSDKYAFMCKLILIDVEVKDNSVVMPILQASKCTQSINAIVDNGRILQASYVEIYIDEQRAKLIKEQYRWRKHICIDTYYSSKRYLPRWFTDYVYKLFCDKCTLKGADPINYQISKAKLNSCYGMCVQKAIQSEIVEDYDTGEYTVKDNYNAENYDKYVKNINKFLPYQWGCWVTSYAEYNVHRLGSMCDTWIYSDTDSVYGQGWDHRKVLAYNKECEDKLKDRGYDPVVYKGKKYVLGSATVDGIYSEYTTLGAKRYACREAISKELHITVAGVPKKGVATLKNDINNFKKGIIFTGTVSGKKKHEYRYVDKIYTDKDGNITGDSIDLTPCDYLLDDIKLEDFFSLFSEEIVINAYVDQ